MFEFRSKVFTETGTKMLFRYRNRNSGRSMIWIYITLRDGKSSLFCIYSEMTITILRWQNVVHSIPKYRFDSVFSSNSDFSDLILCDKVVYILGVACYMYYTLLEHSIIVKYFS